MKCFVSQNVFVFSQMYKLNSEYSIQITSNFQSLSIHVLQSNFIQDFIYFYLLFFICNINYKYRKILTLLMLKV
jgi:hypothetical protein